MNDFEIIELALRRAAGRISNPDVKLGLEIAADEMLQMKLQQAAQQSPPPNDLDDEIPF